MCIDVHDMNGRKPQRRNAFAGEFKFSAEHDIALVLHAMKKAAPRIFMSGTVGRVKYNNRLRYIRDNSEAVQYLMASQGNIRSLSVAALELYASKHGIYTAADAATGAKRARDAVGAALSRAKAEAGVGLPVGGTAREMRAAIEERMVTDTASIPDRRVREAM